MIYNNTILTDLDKVMMVDTSALVKGVRQFLGLTQAQFAREFGVTCSAVNHWENGRRRPQPFLLGRLWEMEGAWDQGSGGRLTRGAAKAFKRR